MIKFWLLALAVVLFGWLTVAGSTWMMTTAKSRMATDSS